MFKITYKKPLTEVVPSMTLKIGEISQSSLKGAPLLLKINKDLGEILNESVSFEVNNEYGTKFNLKSQKYLASNFKIFWNDQDAVSTKSPPKELIVPYFSQKGDGHGKVAGFSENHQFHPTSNVKKVNFTTKMVKKYLFKKKEVKDKFGFCFGVIVQMFSEYFKLNCQLKEKHLSDLIKVISQAINDTIFKLDDQLNPEWTSATIFASFKGGNPEDASKYRPLTLLPAMNRCLDFIIMDYIANFVSTNNLINRNIQKGQLREHNGSWEHRIEVNHRLMKMSQDKSSKVVLFLDIQNAFGSVNYELMWNILSKIKVPKAIIDYLRLYYKQLKVDYKGESFDWMNGLLQSSATSNILFLIYMDQAIKHFHQMGTKMGVFKASDAMDDNSFAFVDDCTFIFERDERLSDVMKVLHRSFGDFGLSIAPHKTYYVEFLGEDLDLKLGSEKINRVPDDFKYLGHPLVISPTFASQVKDKIVGKMNEIMTLPVSADMKVFIYENLIMKRLDNYFHLCEVMKIDISEIEFEEKYFFAFLSQSVNDFFKQRNEVLKSSVFLRLHHASTKYLTDISSQFKKDKLILKIKPISRINIKSIKNEVEKYQKIVPSSQKDIVFSKSGSYSNYFLEQTNIE